MFCVKCGTQLSSSVHYCPRCGYYTETSNYKEEGRGNFILACGFLSLLTGPLFGIPAWVMGITDNRKIRRGLLPPEEKSKTETGMILGIVTSMLSVFVMPALVVAINLFNANAETANRDEVISDLNNLGAIAQQYYKKPASMGGGGNSFVNWSIPTGLEYTPSGKYTASAEPDYVIITGIGVERGIVGRTPVMHTARVTETFISIEKNN